jgi:hypothetical protein
MPASFSPNVVVQKTPKNVKWLSPTGETTLVVSQGGGRFLLVATNHIPKQQVWPGVDNNHSLKRIMRSSGLYVQPGLYTQQEQTFMVLLKSHNSLDLEAVEKVSSSNKEKTNKLYKH